MDSQSKTDYRPVLGDRRRTSPAHPHHGSGPGPLRRQRTAEGSLSPAPSGGCNGRDSRNVFDRLAQDGARRYRALSPPEGRDTRMLRKGGGSYNSATSDTWSARRSPRTPLASPTTTSSNHNEDNYYPRGPYSPSKGAGSTGFGDDASRSRHSPNASLIKQRRSTSEGPGGRDATLVDIVDQLGGDKAESQQMPDGSPTHAHQDDYADVRVPPSRGDPRRPLDRDLAAQLRRLQNQNDKLRKQVEVISKEKKDLELEKEKTYKDFQRENQQLRAENDREKRTLKEGSISVKEADRELEILKAQHDQQLFNLRAEHGKEMLKQKAEHEKEVLKQKADHEKEVAKIQSTRSREKAEAKDLIWRLESQLKLDKNAQALLSPAEAGRILRIREESSSTRNIELEFENAILRDDLSGLKKEHQRTQLQLEMMQRKMSQVAGLAETGESPKKAAGGGA